MIYSELQDLCFARKITVKSLYNALGMTRSGFQAAIDNQSLPIKRLLPLCSKLGISPNQFFGIEETPTTIAAKDSAVQLGGNSNTLNYALSDNETIKLLSEQIKEKDRQLSEKDKQISQLMKLLSK